MDAEFTLRAVARGHRFASTGVVTVHKFAAGHRYLYYLMPGSDEQAAALEQLSGPGGDACTTRSVEAARAAGLVMSMRHGDYTGEADGAVASRARRLKGLERPEPRQLRGRQTIRQTDEPRALDWYALQVRGEDRFRWSGPSPAPRLLLPFVCDRVATVAVDVLGAVPGYFEGLAIEVNRATVRWNRQVVGARRSRLHFETRLAADAPSIVTFRGPTLPMADFLRTANPRRVGFAAGDVEVEPE